MGISSVTLRAQFRLPMRISVIVLTYERSDALDLVLRGLMRQTVLPDEVIVTDDGSGPATRACVVQRARGFPSRLVFLTGTHDGPRMGRARNRGIAAATGDYVIFLDGDMIPSRHFIADHVAFARPGSFVQGSRVLTSDERARTLLAEGRLDVGFFESGLDRRRHLLRVSFLRALYGRPHKSRTGAKSCNLAFWRDDLVRLNGFNEAMEGWGLEDAELAARAFHAGLVRRDLRLGGSAVHLWHPPKRLAADNPNWPILDDTVARRLVRCERGLEPHLHEREPSNVIVVCAR